MMIKQGIKQHPFSILWLGNALYHLLFLSFPFALFPAVIYFGIAIIWLRIENKKIQRIKEQYRKETPKFAFYRWALPDS